MSVNISNGTNYLLEQRLEKQKVCNYNSELGIPTAGNPALLPQKSIQTSTSGNPSLSIRTPTAGNPSLLVQASPFVTKISISKNSNFQTPTAKYPTNILNNFDIKLTSTVTPGGPLLLTPHVETCRPHLTTPMETDDVDL